MSDEAYLTALADRYRLKYSRHRFEVVISTDDAALRFLVRHRQELFPDSPVVFCGVDEVDKATLSDQTWATGLIESTDVKANFSLALRLHPGTVPFPPSRDSDIAAIRVCVSGR
jgi:hypothetical protein